MCACVARRGRTRCRSAPSDAPVPRNLREIFGFHVQQAAEKSLKAWLALLGKVYPLTHNLEALLELFSEANDVSRRFRKLIDYTPYAVEFRYEGIESGTDPIDRKGALTLVEALLAHVRRQLPETRNPS
ncbi:MAG: HEPN domain-containing protein [Spirochaetaceae bacterium]|nr:HEPN domain-containing protein [Spirochaetaceae bacterium]